MLTNFGHIKSFATKCWCASLDRFQRHQRQPVESTGLDWSSSSVRLLHRWHWANIDNILIPKWLERLHLLTNFGPSNLQSYRNFVTECAQNVYRMCTSKKLSLSKNSIKLRKLEGVPRWVRLVLDTPCVRSLTGGHGGNKNLSPAFSWKT